MRALPSPASRSTNIRKKRANERANLRGNDARVRNSLRTRVLRRAHVLRRLAVPFPRIPPSCLIFYTAADSTSNIEHNISLRKDLRSRTRVLTKRLRCSRNRTRPPGGPSRCSMLRCYGAGCAALPETVRATERARRPRRSRGQFRGHGLGAERPRYAGAALSGEDVSA